MSPRSKILKISGRKMRESYLSIQYLRAIAAIMVVIYHARNPQPWLFNPLETFHGLARGVDIFFVISGFIMAAIGSKEPPMTFARKRIIRVAPIYWLTSLLAAGILLRKSDFDTQFLSHIAMSLAFVPHLNPANEAFPVLPPGWTLNYEMYFYAIFFACLWTKKPIRNCTISLITLTATGALIDEENIVSKTYTNHLLLDFVCGLTIGHFRQKISSIPALSALAPIGFATLMVADNWIVAMAGASLTVTGSVAMEKKLKNQNLLKKMGDASYFTYLSHHFVLAVLLKIWPLLPVAGWLQFISLMITCTVASCIIGLIGHEKIENPLTRKITKLFNPKQDVSSTRLQKL